MSLSTSTRIRAAGAMLFSAATCASSLAHANGRYPLATQLVESPVDPSYLALRSTFGILQTFDAGKSWSWVCEQAAGYTDIRDPTIALSGDGTLLVGADKLNFTADRGCTWSASGFTATSVTDLAVDPTQPKRVVALVATSDGQGQYTNRLFASDDGGRTFTVDLATQRIYVTGKYWPAQVAALESSDDGGATWSRKTIDAAGAALPFIAAIDPTNADRVYVRTAGSDSDGVFVTSDAGGSWMRIFTATGGIQGFALAPDGLSVAVGGPSSGVNVASVSDYQFQMTNILGPYCLRWTSAGLYACGKQNGDGFALGLSVDRGVTFAKVLELPSLAPRACASGSATTTICAPVWGPIATLIGADAGPDASKPPPDPGLNPLNENPKSGCGCRARGRERYGAAFWFVSFSFAVLTFRRVLSRATGSPVSRRRGRPN